MGMALHELHASLVHAPLALLPAAAAFDLAAALKGSRELSSAGLKLWVAGSAGALLSGIAGLAASQEVRAEDPRVRDAMLVHGLGNTAITLGALALTAFRSKHRATIGSALIGFAACGAAVFTAYLGGAIVYSRGVGVKSMPVGASEGIIDDTPLLSLAAPAKLLRDAAGGLGWVVRAASAKFSGERLEPAALTGHF